MATTALPTSRIVVVGDSNAGKTSLMGVVCRGSTAATSPTVGFEFSALRRENDVVHFWDTAGMERFRCITPNYFRKIDACWVVVDASDVDRKGQALYWLDFARKHTDRPLLLVLTKTDLLLDRYPKFEFSMFGVPCVEGNVFESRESWLEKLAPFLPEKSRPVTPPNYRAETCCSLA